MQSSRQDIAKGNEEVQEAKVEAFPDPCSSCNKHLAKYVCPRCSRGYCSFECYLSLEHTPCRTEFERDKRTTRDVEKERMLKTLEKYNVKAPEDGGALQYVGDEEELIKSFTAASGFGPEELEHDQKGRDVSDTFSQDEESEDEESVQRRRDLEVRMAGLDIENADFEEIWERLDSQEREEFVKLAQELEKEELSSQ